MQSERMFTVIAPMVNKSSLQYPMCNAQKSIVLLRSLTLRGFHPIARTSANGVTEDINLTEMESIYSD